MAEEKLLTIREVSLILGISEKEVIALAESQTIPAYRIGGVYLRFRRHQVEEYRKVIRPQIHKRNILHKISFADKLSDFFYFNDFYILSFIAVAVILVIIFRGL